MAQPNNSTLGTGTSTTSNPTPELPTTSHQQQESRQHWMKELPGQRRRYPLMQWWQDQMNVLSGVGYNPDRMKK